MNRPGEAPPRDLSRTVLAVLLLVVLIGGALWIVRPFVMPTVWASMLVVATWPLLLRLERIFGGRRGAAATGMTVALILVLLVPLSLAIGAVVANADDVSAKVEELKSYQVPPPPHFLEKVPLVGERLVARWREAQAGGPGYLTAKLSPFLSGAVRWLIASAGSAGRLTVDLLITVVVAAILYVNGDRAAKGLSMFATRLIGKRGDHVVRLGGQAIRGVALGVVVTALAQGAAAGLGLLVVGIPYPLALTALCFVLAVAQIGPLPVLLPAVIWTWWDRGTVWGVGFLVWSVLVGLINNFLQPVLIKRGADLPMLLIFVGVVGGLVSAGIVGIFVGPVLLAVTYTLLVDWVREARAE
jgi:predicted PurR-regulated permease PerM